MKTYPDELKSSIIKKLLPPINAYIPELSKETGIPKDTLYAWRIKYRGQGQAPRGQQSNSESNYSSAEKFDIVIETAHMNEAELSAYCRQKGLYPDQISAWRSQCRDANQIKGSREDRKKVSQQGKKIRQLESELKRKEKALAEAAALLVLRKKVQQIWGDPEDD